MYFNNLIVSCGDIDLKFASFIKRTIHKCE
jgi:hypothetical protein